MRNATILAACLALAACEPPKGTYKDRQTDAMEKIAAAANGAATSVSGTGVVKPIPAMIPYVLGDEYDGCKCSPAAMSVASSLDFQAPLWSGDNYGVQRAGTGHYVWVANREYGLTVSIGGWEKGPRAFEGPEFEQDRKLIWRAYQRWAIKQIAPPRASLPAGVVQGDGNSCLARDLVNGACPK